MSNFIFRFEINKGFTCVKVDKKETPAQTNQPIGINSLSRQAFHVKI